MAIIKDKVEDLKSKFAKKPATGDEDLSAEDGEEDESAEDDLSVFDDEDAAPDAGLNITVEEETPVLADDQLTGESVPPEEDSSMELPPDSTEDLATELPGDEEGLEEEEEPADGEDDILLPEEEDEEEEDTEPPGKPNPLTSWLKK